MNSIGSFSLCLPWRGFQDFKRLALTVRGFLIKPPARGHGSVFDEKHSLVKLKF